MIAGGGCDLEGEWGSCGASLIESFDQLHTSKSNSIHRSFDRLILIDSESIQPQFFLEHGFFVLETLPSSIKYTKKDAEHMSINLLPPDFLTLARGKPAASKHQNFHTQSSASQSLTTHHAQPHRDHYPPPPSSPPPPPHSPHS